ncbi:MAG TPA: aminopeptidase [Thermoplasmata archaeon]|nr:aminopeptidase [Thermoplasmata archaeon]
MSDPISPDLRRRIAQSLLKNNLQLRSGERVIIEAWPHTLPYAVALAREVRRMGAFPLVPYEDEAGYWDAVDDGEFEVLGKAAAHEWAALMRSNVYIHMWGPGDRVRLGRLPPKKAGRLFAFNDAWYRAARAAGLRGLRLELGRPHPALAKAYDVDLDRWTEQVARATLVNPDALRPGLARIGRALGRGRDLRIRHPNGTDLHLRLSGAAPRPASGRPVVGDPKRPFDLLANVPAGAIRVALDTAVADGTIVANRTCYYEDGTATGGVFRFRNGQLTSAEFESGQARFDAGYKVGGKGRDRPGMLGIGLNPALRDTPQLEDVERGAIMVSVGGNRILGGRNPSGFFGWVMNAGGTLEIDGKPLAIGA